MTAGKRIDCSVDREWLKKETIHQLYSYRQSLVYVKINLIKKKSWNNKNICLRIVISIP
jgi:hypothetical protein